jgi:hypothetical protein
MYARAPQQTAPMCTFCKSIGKSEREYTSHFIHKTKSLSSRITCPELLKRVCLNCPGNNHTSDRCPKMNTVQVCFSSEKKSLNKKCSSAEKSSSAEKKETKNRFAGLEDDSDDEQNCEEKDDEKNESFIDLEMGIPREPISQVQPAIAFWEDIVNDLPSRLQMSNIVDSVLRMDNRADQINYIGEEIYTHVAVRDPQRAGKITGMILELDDITELLYMLETPELFKSIVADCVRVIEQPV